MDFSWRAAAGVAGAVALLATAACDGSEGQNTTSSAKGVEIVTWWTDGGERAGLEALVTAFDDQCPDYSFVDGSIAGGAGVPAKTVLSSRLAQVDPPDAFQAHVGVELTDYVEAGQIEDLTQQFADWGLDTAFPQTIMDSLTVDGRIYAIPTGVHRTNVVWANQQVLADAGITSAPTTLEQFLANLELLKTRGVATPLAVGRDWTQLMLLEAVLISELGPTDFTELWTDSSLWSSKSVTKAIGDYERLLSYSNRDRDTLDWTDSEMLLREGTAAYQLMGDWEAADLEANGFTDYSHFVFPGNGTAFAWTADAFVLPVEAKNRSGAECWLRTVASDQAQQAFSLAKGSLPAREDTSSSGFSAYQQATSSAWGWGALVPSCAHGTACSQGLQGAINAAIGRFSTDLNVEALQSALETAVSQETSD